MQHAIATAEGDLRAYLLLAYLAALRAHEIAKIRGQDIHPNSPGSIAVVGKGGRATRLPLHPDLSRLAEHYPSTGHWFPFTYAGTAHIYPGLVSTRVRTHLRSLGVTTGSIHRVRASYATELLRSGVNVRIVQDLMRHRSLASTEHYLGVAEDDRRNAIAGLRIA